jgi:hypothetical protein
MVLDGAAIFSSESQGLEDIRVVYWLTILDIVHSFWTHDQISPESINICR